MQLIVGDKTYQLDVIKPSLMIFATIFSLSTLYDNFGADSSVYLVVALISFTFMYSLHVLIQHRKVSGIAVFYQIFLFTLLYPLIFKAFGPDHYDIAGRPHPFEWIQFIGAHIIRAVDVLDIVGEYQISLQTIHHRSFIVGASLVGMHWIIDIFFLAILFRKNAFTVIARGLEGSRSTAWWTFGISIAAAVVFPPLGMITFLAFVYLAFLYTIVLLHRVYEGWRRGMAGLEKGYIPIFSVFIAFYFIRALNEGWSALDTIFLWPLDQFIRLVDIGDSLQIFQMRLHSAPINSVNSAMAIFFRVVLGIAVTKYVQKLRLLHLKGFGLSHEEIILNLKSTDEEFQQAARDLIQKTLQANPNSLADFVHALSLMKEDNKHIEDFIWKEIQQNLPKHTEELDRSLEKLLRNLLDPQHQKVTLKALNLFFPHWRIHSLTRSKEKFFLGYLQHKDSTVVIGALEALTINSDKTIRAVKKLVYSKVPYEVKRKALEKIAESNSGDAMMLLCQFLTAHDYDLRTSAEETLVTLDTDWQKYAARELIDDFRDGLHKKDWRMGFICLKDHHQTREAAAYALGALGKLAAPEISDLTQALVDPSLNVARQASVSLNKIDSLWYKSRRATEQIAFLEEMVLKHPSRYTYAEEALHKIQTR